MILTAKTGTNADLFPDVLSIYVPEGSRVIDMTYANGVFWKKVDITKYDLVTNDLFNPKAANHEDFRRLSFPDKSFDAVVLDPPYFPTHNKGKIMADSYHNMTTNSRNPKQIMELYFAGYAEALRILKDGGVLIVKCQDQVDSGKQFWFHTKLMVHPGFEAEDIFVLVVRSALMDPRWKRQLHARKNHSYFLVLRKL
jgi:hypothetical protein